MLALGALLLITIVIYWSSLKNGLTTMDDSDYIINNPAIKNLSWSSIGNIFSSFYMANYHPLVTLVWAIIYKYSAATPQSYHLVSLLFHLVNIYLVYRFVRLLSNSEYKSLAVALLFAIHPLNVESVAWASELKNLMFACFALLSLIYYTKYSNKPENVRPLVIAGVFFLLSLLSKSAAVVLPLAWFSVDIYTGRKTSTKYFIEKLPFLLISVLFGILAILSQQVVIHSSFTPEFAWFNRVFFAFYSIGYYIAALFAPVHLSAIHFYPEQGATLPIIYYIAVPLVLAMFVGLWFLKKYRKLLLFGLMFYIVNLLMVLQLVPFGQAVVAERYAYLPMIGLLYILITVAGDAIQRFESQRKNAAILSVACLFFVSGFFIYLTTARVYVWKNSQTLFNDFAAKYPDRAFSHFAVANALGSSGDFRGAMDEYKKAEQIKPGIDIYNNRGSLKLSVHDFPGAIIDYSKAIEIDSTQPTIYFNRGMSRLSLNDFQGAAADFKKAMDLKARFIDAITTAAYCYFRMEKLTDAVALYSLAYYYEPKSTIIPFNIATIYQKLGDRTSACEFYHTAAERGYMASIDSVSSYCSK
ncbi:MAG: glycosyltransferase family 39 protein [Bacteroidota bacterium]